MRVFNKLKIGIVAVSLALMCAMPAAARDLVSKVVELDKLPLPIASPVAPTDPNMLFYLQRSTNSNTIVYAANLARPGELNLKNPVEVFWRRYTENGERRGLNFIERTMAYGARVQPVKGAAAEFDAHIVSLPEIKFRISINDKGVPEATVQMENRRVRVVSAYLEVDDSGFIPKLIFLDIYGFDTASGRALHQHLVPR